MLPPSLYTSIISSKLCKSLNHCILELVSYVMIYFRDACSKVYCTQPLITVAS